MNLELDIRGDGYRVVAARADSFEDEAAFDAALTTMSEYRRGKVESYRFAKDRRLSLLVGVLLDELLRDLGLRERDMLYGETANGKPVFANHGDLHFNLAHSGNMAIAALSTSPIGVDVEHLPTFAYDVAEPYEWTKMESVGKLLGCGVGAFVDGAAFSVPDGVSVQHVELGDHLACIALFNQV